MINLESLRHLSATGQALLEASEVLQIARQDQSRLEEIMRPMSLMSKLSCGHTAESLFRQQEAFDKQYAVGRFDALNILNQMGGAAQAAKEVSGLLQFARQDQSHLAEMMNPEKSIAKQLANPIAESLLAIEREAASLMRATVATDGVGKSESLKYICGAAQAALETNDVLQFALKQKPHLAEPMNFEQSIAKQL